SFLWLLRHERTEDALCAFGISVTVMTMEASSQPSSQPSHVSEYIQEILERRAFMLLDTVPTMKQKKESEIGLALSAKIVQNCHQQIRLLEKCAAADRANDEDCQNAQIIASECANSTSEKAIDSLIRDYSSNGQCSNAFAKVAESPGDSQSFESLLHCCAQRHLDSLANQFEFDSQPNSDFKN
ncbi:hypothetical protein BVRB_031160, partial [Beta vulgaris subsp. vulgaris]